MREAKVEEFINLKQRSITVREYSVGLLSYQGMLPSFVLNNKDEESTDVC